MTKQRIFVAGHRGMVGSAIVRQLEQRGDVEVVVRTRDELNLLDSRAVQDFFANERIDQVYLAAAKVGGIVANNTYPADFIYENMMIESNIIHAAHLHNVNKLLFLGSSCIYPKMAKQPIAESELLQGTLEATNEPYAIAKIAGIKLCESYNRQYNRDYRSVMPTNLYGPHDNFHPSNSHVIPALLRRFHEATAENAPDVVVWGSGTPMREFLHVDDMAAASIHVMELDREVWQENTEPMLSHINVGTGVDCTIRELAQTIAKVVAWASKMGKTPIVVNDCPGFFVNRVLFPYFAGFSQLLRDGADFRKIDKVMEKQFGWPMGPAYLLDVVGIDTAHHAQAVMAAGFPQRMQKDYRDAIDALFDANRFGQKNGLGFWRYKEDSKGKPKKEEDPAVDGLLADVSQPKRDFTDDEIIARMMIPMINEVVRCLEEGIIASPAEADMALVYGLGFPPFHGGAFRWLDTLGSARYLDMAQQYQHLGPLYEVPEGLRNKARHNEPYYPAVEPARPVGTLKTA